MFEPSSADTVTLVWIFSGWLLALVLKRGDLADIYWGLGILALAAATVIDRLNSGVAASAPALLVLAMTAAWAIRLSLHIGIRGLSKSEDARYAAWREQWGKNYPWRSLLQIWILQALIARGVAWPVLGTIESEPRSLALLDGVAVGIWATGLAFETIADLQLARFMKVRQPGQILDTGLWRYSRHPNYFGEVLLWWGIGLLAVQSVGPTGWIGPVLMTALILGVSGVPMLESKARKNPKFLEYAARTSAFFPLPPKNGRK